MCLSFYVFDPLLMFCRALLRSSVITVCAALPHLCRGPSQAHFEFFQSSNTRFSQVLTLPPHCPPLPCPLAPTGHACPSSTSISGHYRTVVGAAAAGTHRQEDILVDSPWPQRQYGVLFQAIRFDSCCTERCD